MNNSYCEKLNDLKTFEIIKYYETRSKTNWIILNNKPGDFEIMYF